MEKMPLTMTRRDMLSQTLLACVTPSLMRGMARGPDEGKLKTRLAELDKRSGGRLGCAVLNTATGTVIAHRGDERFPMCSTFKASEVAFVLQRVDRGQEHLDRRIPIYQRDILSYAPITKLHVNGDMSVAELCSAALSVSDNTAANLLLASFGGPTALTGFWRSIGDHVTRLDRIEPAMSESAPGDPRDTTSPVAMLEDLRKFVLGDVLKPATREMHTKWMVANTTGDARLRAGLRHDWIVGDKTGSGDHETTNDIAVIWPPNRKPFLVTAFLTQGPATDDARNAILADVGRAVAEEIASA